MSLQSLLSPLASLNPSSLSALITKLDRRLAAFTISALAHHQQISHEQQAHFFSGPQPPPAAAAAATATGRAGIRLYQQQHGRGFGQAILASVRSSASSLPSSTSPVSSFVLVEPRAPQAFPLLGIFGFPLPILHQLALIALTVLLAFLLSILLREAASSTHHSWGWTTLVELVDSVMVIFTGNSGGALVGGSGGIGLSSRESLPTRIANAFSSFPSAGAGASAITLSAGASNGKGRALRRSQVTGSTNTRGAANIAASTAGLGHQDLRFYPGLRNTGNTCFFNSVIQSLASCPTLLQHLDQVTEFAEAWDVPTPVTDALREVVTRLNSPTARRAPAILPSALTSALSASNGTRSLTAAHQQQDAHELFALLSDALESELSEIQRERRSVLFSSGRGLAAAIAPTRARSAEWVVPSPAAPGLDSSGSAFPGGMGAMGGNGDGEAEGPGVAVADEQPGDPQHPFKGWTAQRTGCVDCGYTEGIRHLSSEELTLTVPQFGGRGVALEALLDEWSKLEVVQWTCHRCSLRATADRVRAEVVRLGGGDPAASLLPSSSKMITSSNGHHHHHHQQPDAVNGTKDGGPGQAMTVSKKRRLKDAQRAYERIQRVLQLNIHEDELNTSSPSLLPPDLKLERVMSRCATKQIMLARPPRLLVVHLNRSIFGGFGGGASKNNTFVHFGEWLDMQPFATGPELEVRSDRRISGGQDQDQALDGRGGLGGTRSAGPSCLYRLQSIVVHYGGHSFGHYVSYRRRPASVSPASSASLVGSRSAAAAAEWMRISDDIVEPCDLGDVLASNPFLLFYEKWDGQHLAGLQAGPTSSNDGSGESLSEGGSPPTPARATPSNLDDIDDDAGVQHVTALAASRSRGMSGGTSLPEAVEPRSSEVGALDLDRLRVRVRVRPRVVQRWESPAPRASL
ncbi:hypothetical protein V8E36_008938 [Tilletia maclaganii]